MKKRVLIIGGGASGMMAAVQAARNGAKVTILEHTGQVGKKLLSTGNGRCNLTNLYQAPECYRCRQEGFVWETLRQFSLEDTLSFFQDLGILLKDRQGYVYPNSDQAVTILEGFQTELERQGIQVIFHCHIEKILWKNVFEVHTDQGCQKGDSLILASGSKAASFTGSDGSGYELAKQLGHTIVTPLPALVQLRCREKHYKQLAGVRTEARVRLMACSNKKEAGWKTLAEDEGELQLTDYGISGIPTFQISRYASVSLHKGLNVKVNIDFLPQQSVREVEDLIDFGIQNFGYKTWEQWICGILNNKLGLVLLKLAGLNPQKTLSSCLESQKKMLLKQIKSYETFVDKVNPFEKAQVCCGGVEVSEICPRTMESKKRKGLYFAGEVIDVDGICGGYNLQWAWSSGATAGRSAAISKKTEEYI